MQFFNILIPVTLIFSCTVKNSEQKSEFEHTLKKNDNSLTIKYLFEDNQDTVERGDTIDFAMAFSNTEFDSISVFIGRLDSLTLMDTTAILEVKDNSVFFTFIPTEIGSNSIEGLVKEYDRHTDGIVVKSTAFSFNYYCKERWK